MLASAGSGTANLPPLLAAVTQRLPWRLAHITWSQMAVRPTSATGLPVGFVVAHGGCCSHVLWDYSGNSWHQCDAHITVREDRAAMSLQGWWKGAASQIRQVESQNNGLCHNAQCREWLGMCAGDEGS